MRMTNIFPLSPLLNVKSVHIFKGEVGYDGQMFLTIALDPALKHEGTIAALDNPKYRYRRIGYPILGYLLGLGNPKLIPYSMVLINVLCIIILFLFVTKLRDKDFLTGNDIKSSPLLMLAIPGIWVSLSLSTSDLLGTTLLATSLLLLNSRRDVLASLVLSGACLTREVYLLTAIAFSLYMLIHRRKKASVSFFLCIVPAVCWYFYVNMRMQVGTFGLQENLSFIPFAGIIDKIRSIAEVNLGISSIFEVFCFMIFLMITVYVIFSVVHSIKNLDAWVILFLLSGGKWFAHSVRGLLLLSGIASAGYIANYIIS